MRDDDKQPSEEVEKAFTDQGGVVFSWRDGRALEDELFQSLPIAAMRKIIDYAVELHGDELIDQHIKSASTNLMDLQAVRAELATGAMSAETRAVLGRAARARKAGWFKSVSSMEEVAREIAAPALPQSEAGFRDIVNRIFAWARNG
jgi:hypothetical protein